MRDCGKPITPHVSEIMCLRTDCCSIQEQAKLYVCDGDGRCNVVCELFILDLDGRKFARKLYQAVQS